MLYNRVNIEINLSWNTILFIETLQTAFVQTTFKQSALHSSINKAISTGHQPLVEAHVTDHCM